MPPPVGLSLKLNALWILLLSLLNYFYHNWLNHHGKSYMLILPHTPPLGLTSQCHMVNCNCAATKYNASLTQCISHQYWPYLDDS
jgi:hypothetical protein